jgi:transcriptional regulator GlxA family with amidase domain
MKYFSKGIVLKIAWTETIMALQTNVEPSGELRRYGGLNVLQVNSPIGFGNRQVSKADFVGGRRRQSVKTMGDPKFIGVVTFDGFETLDVYGPLGLLVSAALGNPYKAVLISPPNATTDHVSTSSNLPTLTPHKLQWPTKEKYDILLIPGGIGNRPLLKNAEFLEILKKNVEAVLADGGTILCVCTGSVLLAATGLLNGKSATTNKKAYDALTPNYPNVQWQRHARWLHDGQIISSSGITAGMVCPRDAS